MAGLVYLDWAATAPLCAQAREAMEPFLQPGVAGLQAGGGNANSLYTAGRSAFKALEDARARVARGIGARPDELIFTSGATEANNAALAGMVEALQQQAVQQAGSQNLRVVVSAIEHDAVLNAASALQRKGVQVAFVQPSASGHITPETLREALAEPTALVSIMAVNNETGAAMDVAALAEEAHRAGALFHCDATQALGKVEVSVRTWGVDAASFSSHKVAGPKGVGALYLKARTPFSAQALGGGQEMGKRSGTQNVAGAVGFAAAVEYALATYESEVERLGELRSYALETLCALEGVEPMMEHVGEYACHIVALAVPGVESETLILQLDNRGICVSGGSACSSHSLEPSHALSAMGIERQRALSSLRLSFGELTTRQNIDALSAALSEIIAQQKGTR